MKGSGDLGAASVIRLGAIALLAGVNAWMAASVFEPLLNRNGRIGYVFVSASFATLAASVAVAAAGVVALHRWLTRRGEPRQLTILLWAALPLVALVNLDRSIAGQVPTLSYVLYDLRAGVWLLTIAAFAASVGFRPREPGSWRAASTGLACLLVAVAVVATPHLRFGSALHGDEPKYLRFCENWYQGLGFDVSAKRRLTDEQARADVFGNVALVARAVREEVSLLADDVAHWIRGRAAASPRAEPPSADMFFAGKHPPAVYQLHNPGLSFLLFPAYYVDRAWTGRGIGYQAEFPALLPAVNVLLLGFYAAFGLALVAMLRASALGPAWAWAVSALAALALPAGAFPFQIYPEIPAALIVALSIRRLLTEPSPSNARRDLLFGLLVGFLPWLHVRLTVACAVLVAGLFIPRRRWWIPTGAAIAVAALCLYTYRLTGSLLPIATYGSDAPLTLGRLTHGVPGFAFDRTYGVLPHSPIFFLAVPGLVALWRTNRRLASVVAALLLAIVLPAAGHGFWAGGGTPGRYLVVAVPILALCLAHATMALGGTRWFGPIFAALAIVSLETAVRYNLHHLKDVGPLVAPGFAGWRPNLLFPAMGTAWPLSRPDVALLVAWCLVALSLLAVRRQGPSAGFAQKTLVRDTMLALAGVAVVGIPVAAVTGQAWAAGFLPSRADARAAALTMFGRLSNCAVCYSSALGAVEPTRALGNDPALVDIRPPRGAAVAGRPVPLEIRPRTTTGDYMLGDILVDFGDGTATTYARHFGDLPVSHVFREPGEYRIRASCGWGGREATAEIVVRVGPR